jgi:hypothetical protein
MLNFSINSTELATVDLQIKATGQRLREQIKDAVGDGAEAAEKIMLREVPRGETDRLAQSIHIDADRVFYAAGGIGGGGYWQSQVSAGRGVPYTKHVVEGTGIHAGKGNIHPNTASMMKWEGARAWGDPKKAAKGMRGNKHFAFETEGQEAQTDWITLAQEAARSVIALRVSEIDRGI